MTEVGVERTKAEKLRVWLADHNGVVAMSKLVEIGYSEHAVYRMVRRGELVRMQPGVYLSAHYPRGALQEMTAVSMRNEEFAIGYLTAAREWGFRSLPKDLLIYVLVPNECNAKLNGVVVRRCNQIDAVDHVLRADGVRLTSPPRTLFDIADAVGDWVTTSIMEQLLSERKVTFVTHAATFARLAHPQRPGTATMARVISARPKWSKAVQSELELIVLKEIRRQRLPEPVVQHVVTLTNGRTVRFDFAWPAQLASLEVDHPFWHDGEGPSNADAERDRHAAVDGWLTVRLKRLSVERGLSAAISEFGDILRTRSFTR
jgi:hypothetical protein